MSRLIDAEEYEQALIANGWDESDDEFSAGGIFEILHEAPTVQAIPLDKVKQARRELDKLPIYGAKFTDDFRIHLDREEVFSILDKLIAESEG